MTWLKPYIFAVRTSPGHCYNCIHSVSDHCFADVFIQAAANCKDIDQGCDAPVGGGGPAGSGGAGAGPSWGAKSGSGGGGGGTATETCSSFFQGKLGLTRACI